jgi:SpoVK/Ycf46/Vps4 family AAA+-type ATPase
MVDNSCNIKIITKSTIKNLTNKSNICLYGPPGSGKSAVSKTLGHKLNMTIYDVDDDHLEVDWGISVAEKLELLGDDAFLKAEAGKNFNITNYFTNF